MKMTKKGRQKFRNFPEKNVEIFWWSANRDKICQVVRESEKVENRCFSSSQHSQSNITNCKPARSSEALHNRVTMQQWVKKFFSFSLGETTSFCSLCDSYKLVKISLRNINIYW